MLSEFQKVTQGKSKVKVSNKVKDYGNDPFFVKKAKESKEFLQKHGFPKELLIKK
jgi:predicted RND superfamily exporter protein